MKRMRIFKTNKQIQSNRDSFIIGVMFIVDGFISVLSLGRFCGCYSADTISKIMLKNIRLRREKRKLKQISGENNG